MNLDFCDGLFFGLGFILAKEFGLLVKSMLKACMD